MQLTNWVPLLTSSQDSPYMIHYSSHREDMPHPRCPLWEQMTDTELLYCFQWALKTNRSEETQPKPNMRISPTPCMKRQTCLSMKRALCLKSSLHHQQVGKNKSLIRTNRHQSSIIQRECNGCLRIKRMGFLL